MSVRALREMMIARRRRATPPAPATPGALRPARSATADEQRPPVVIFDIQRWMVVGASGTVRASRTRSAGRQAPRR